MEILIWLSKIDTHQILIGICCVVAVWAAIKSVTSSRNKSWLVILGVALGGAGILVFLRWHNKKLLRDVEEIQVERDKIAERIADRQKEINSLSQQDSVEAEKLKIQIATHEKAQKEKDKTAQELQGTIDDLKREFNL